MKSAKYLMAILCSLPIACAAAASAQEPITLEQSIRLVLERNPLLRGARQQETAALARARGARLSTPLSVKLELENFAGSGDASGRDIMETTLSLARVLELGNQAQLRGELALHKADLLRHEQAAEQLDLLAETTRLFVTVVTNQEHLTIASERMRLANNTLNVVARRFKAGKTPVAEHSQAIIEVARAEIELEHAEHQLAASRRRLATAWGDRELHADKAEGDLFALNAVENFHTLERLLDQNPDVVRLATAQRVAEARLRLARADRRPDLDIAGGIRYLDDSDDVALVLSASMPLGSRRRAAPAIKESEALARAEPLALEQRRIELYATLFEIHQELIHSRTGVEVLRQRIIPEAARALRDLEKGYALGRYSFLELLTAQRTLLDARLEAVNAAADYHRYRAEIDRLTGAALVPGATP